MNVLGLVGGLNFTRMVHWKIGTKYLLTACHGNSSRIPNCQVRLHTQSKMMMMMVVMMIIIIIIIAIDYYYYVSTIF
jgi:hypothetical protein